MGRWHGRSQCAAKNFILFMIAMIPALSHASRSTFYKVDADARPEGSLRGKTSAFRRLRVSEENSHHEDTSIAKRGLSHISTDADLPDSSFHGMIENRRYSAMEALLHTDEMIFALRFSMGLSMSLDMTPSPAPGQTSAPVGVETPSPMQQPVTLAPVPSIDTPAPGGPPSQTPAPTFLSTTSAPVTPGETPSPGAPEETPSPTPVSSAEIPPALVPGDTPAPMDSIITEVPSETPSRSPTGAPTPMPTIPLVCNGITSEERASQLENQVLSISEIEGISPGSSQEMAYEWLLNDDGLQVCPEDELDVLQRYVLAVLYFSTGGDDWFQCSRSQPGAPSNCPPQDAEFLSDVNVCLWLNVTCAQNEVIEISIDENNLSGTLPSELARLENFEEIGFDGNQRIAGSIPESFGSLQNLVVLDLDDNRLTGTIPDQLFDADSLRTIDMNGNLLEGTISTRIGNLEELRIVMLENNTFTGNLPSEVGQLTHLRYLTLDNNELEGSIPESFEQLSRLQFLTLHNNNDIDGPLPEFLGEFSNLRLLSVFNTNMSGTIPTELGRLDRLEALYLHRTGFTGSMPQEICDLRADSDGGARLEVLTANCGGENPQVACSCCTGCFR